MQLHIVGDVNSQQKSSTRGEPRSAGVASISAKIAETLEQFDTQILAAERALEMLRADHVPASPGPPGRKFSEGEAAPDEPSIPASPADGASQTAEDVSPDQSKDDGAADGETEGAEAIVPWL